jgi:predicted short-subunit dehydrogenase-like oxidoreductase (DUF2520 family)
MTAATSASRQPQVGIVGPGRAGTVLAAACVRAGWRVVAVAGGGEASRARFAASIAGSRACDLAELGARADLVIIAVPDRAVAEVADALAVGGTVDTHHRIVHVAGALGTEPLHRLGLAGARIAACHPAMTMPAGPPDPAPLVGAAWAVTVPAGADGAWAHAFVEALGGQPFDVAGSDRITYHAALAVGSNAVGAAVASARLMLAAAGIAHPEAFLRPLVDASVANVLAHGAAALTGPVMRGDVATVAGHLEALTRDAPALADAYRHLARAVLVHARMTLAAETSAELGRVLDAPEAH